MTKDKRIPPPPDRIVYCYLHWQKMYNILRMHDPSIRWQQGLPNSVLVEKLEDTIVVIEDLMEAGMSDPTLMSTFTEGVITETLVSSLSYKTCCIRDGLAVH